MLRRHWGRRRAGVAAVLAITAAAAVTAGCGGGASNALRLDPVAAAATKTQGAGAARVNLDMVLRGHGRVIRVHGTGAIDGTSSELSVKLPSTAGLPGPNLEHTSAREIALEQNGDYVIYMHLGFLASQLPGGKAWVELDLSKLGKSAGLDLGELLTASQLQPTDLLGILSAEGAKVDKLGPATVDGVATTHYRVTIDLAKALRANGLAGPLVSGVAAHTKAVSGNVWIGEDGLVHRVTLRTSSPLRGAPRLAVKMDVFDYGAHVAIAAPPSSQVFDATEFAQQGLAGALH